jgi:6-phosphogluconolactonase
MIRGKMLIVLCASLLTLAPTIATTFGAIEDLRRAGVYVLTNQPENAVAAFRRDINGLLTPAGRFPTGGAGNPVAQPGDPPVDPLASQGALIMNEGHRFLIAVNAGSNEISLLRIKKDTLELADKVGSGGSRPISVTLHDDLLYVLNEGGTPNITGFIFNECDGTLKPLPNSTRSLVGAANADPAQIAFTPDGGSLVVTEKKGNRLDTYNIDENGRASSPRGNPSSGTTPFGFAFNNDGTLIVSEAFAGMPHQAAVSSYNLGNNGALHVISGSVHNNQTAACWIVIPNNRDVAFASNTGSGTISSYHIGEDGSLTLLNPTAANLGANTAPRDMALAAAGRLLYVQTAGGGNVAAFRVNRNRSLTRIDTAGGLPFGAQGIIAR